MDEMADFINDDFINDGPIDIDYLEAYYIQKSYNPRKKWEPDTEPKLNLCPFCGWPAIFKEGQLDPESCTGFGGFRFVIIQCTHCTVSLVTNEFWDTEGQEKAAKRWNKRCT